MTAAHGQTYMGPPPEADERKKGVKFKRESIIPNREIAVTTSLSATWMESRSLKVEKINIPDPGEDEIQIKAESGAH